MTERELQALLNHVTKSPSLTSQAYTAIRELVLSGEIAPNEKIKIGDLRERLSFGASPIREALSLLSSEGLIEKFEQRGFRASGVSAEEFSELLKTRCWAEERALREAIEHGDDAWQERIVVAEYRVTHTERNLFESNYDETWESMHREFHLALISACPSSHLQQFCGHLYDINVRYRNIASTAAYPGRNAAKEHKDIAKAALARDADKAVDLLIAHYERTGTFLLKRLKALES